MFVRVFDKENDRYYKSIVYALVGIGYYEQAIVVNPFTECFELVEYLEKTKPFPKPLYEVIQPQRNTWVTHGHVPLLKFAAFCNKQGKNLDLQNITGFEDVVGNYNFLATILERKKVAVSEAGVTLRNPEEDQEWNYILTQQDADAFMKLFVGFHDSVLNKLVYEEDNQARQVTAVFDNSGWYGIVELCFEGLIAMNLRPAQENLSRELFDGTLLVKDACVFWADDYMQEENLKFEGSYIKALNLKWRKIG